MGDGDRLHRVNFAYRSFGAQARTVSAIARCPANPPIAALRRQTGQPCSACSHELLTRPGLGRTLLITTGSA